MPDTNLPQDLNDEARHVVRAALGRAIAESEDELDWLPSNFADSIIDLAWRHQFDVDRATFRRRFRDYIKRVAEDATQ